MEKTDRYCLRSVPHNVSHLNTDCVFGFEMEGVAAAIGFIYRDYFTDRESARHKINRWHFFPLSALAVQVQYDFGILITFSKARGGK